MLKNLLLVGLGGAIGSMLRYTAGLLIDARSFPWPAFVVNIIGSFVIGLVFAMSTRDEAFLNNWKLFLGTGICGGFTTFSAFSLDNMELLQSGKVGLAFIYIAVSILLGIAAVFFGYQMMRNS